MDLSAASLAYAERRLATCHQRRMLPDDSPRRVTFVVGDIALLPAPAAGAAATDAAATDAAARTSATPDAAPTTALPVARAAAPTATATLLGERFHLVCCVGVLHHIPNHAAALRVLAEGALLPGGLLQLATYTKLGVDTWRCTHCMGTTWAPHVHCMCCTCACTGTACAPHVHRVGTACAAVYCVCIVCALHIASMRTAHASARRPAARALLHKLLPEVVDNAGALRRVPTAEEVRCVRARLFALAGEEQAAGEATGETAQAGEATGEVAGEAAQVGEAAGEEDRAMAAMLLKFE
eukprot:scaffold14797_cov69-Phaeocystis_antarctica.AAC.2